MAKKTQPYEVDGKTKDFDFVLFKAAFDDLQERRNKKVKKEGRKDRLSKAQLEEQLGRYVNVDQSTVHNWRIGRNAPSSLEIVTQIAVFLGISLEDLLIDHKEEDMDKFTDGQRKAIANVYRDIEDYLYLFAQSDGFIWRDYRIMEGGPYAKYVPAYIDESAWVERDTKREIGFLTDEAVQLMIYRATRGHVFREGADLAEAGYDWVCHSLEREWVELGNHPVYVELRAYLEDALLEIWNGKTDPDYRLEPLDKDDDMSDRSLWTDAARALKGVREIIGKYL